MKEESALTISELKDRYRKAYETMRKDVMHLAEMGLIRQVYKEGKAAKFMVDREKFREYAERTDAA